MRAETLSGLTRGRSFYGCSASCWHDPAIHLLPCSFLPRCLVATDAGIDYALLKYAGAENALSAAIPLDINAATGGCILVLLAGVVQSLMASKTNWARVHYGVPWPHTFAPEKHKDKLKFDMVQRAHLNFVENYPQYLATAFFALQLAPTLATIFGSFFLLGRVVFALGYYSGDATAKNKVRS